MPSLKHALQVVTIGLAAMAAAAPAMPQTETPEVDTALVIAVDISDSVDDSRYALQMKGIAAALEDPGVVSAIAGGDAGRIVVTLVGWADSVEMLLPWRTIASAADAAGVAAAIRALPPRRGEFTCMARMLATLPVSVLSQMPVRARRVVVDVSGDGIDNCTPRRAADGSRDALLAAGATINGLPIIVAGENDVVGAGAYRAPGWGLGALGPETEMTTLDAWYSEHVIGGPGSFVLKAHGYEDFGRAFRMKFVTEISSAQN